MGRTTPMRSNLNKSIMAEREMDNRNDINYFLY